MDFPVDILERCSHEELESLSEDYLSDLRCADLDNTEYFTLRDQSEIPINLCTVGYVPLYGGDQIHKVLALFAPEDTLTAVALYLADQWWSVDDIVRTSNTSREGIYQVRTLGERVVLYVLNRIIYRKQEMERNEVPFLCHSISDYAKILWWKGEAVGFYSVKPSGTTCPSYLSQSYQLPVLDTMFVRKKYRGKAFALQMLEDFVDSFSENALGLRYPMSSTMYTACQRYLEKYPGDQELLWEVEGSGNWFQRTLISSIFQKEMRRLEAKEAAKVVSAPVQSDTRETLPTAEPEANTEDSQEDEQVEQEVGKSSRNDSSGSSKEDDVTPVSTRTRSSHMKRPKIGRKLMEIEEAEESNSTTTNESTILESKEQIVENFKELIQQLAEDKDETAMPELQEVLPGYQGEQQPEETQDTSRVPERNQENKQSAELEPVNGDITEDLFEPPAMQAEKITREALDTGSNLEPGDTDEKSLTTLVSVNMEKPYEDSFPEQGEAPEGMEMSSHENISAGEDNRGLSQEEEFEDRLGDTRRSIPVSGDDFSDNGLPIYEETDPMEKPAASDNTAMSETSIPEKPAINILSDKLHDPTGLCQGPLLVVELEDVAYQQQSEGQRSHSTEQSEESTVEMDHSPQKSVEKAGESSSEDAEPEVPVIERRGLRRKPRSYKGPAKKRSKLAV
ncbi:soluble lamin-associated protein of 75 kDa isoform 2-T3 [Discoglossus pictus]